MKIQEMIFQFCLAKGVDATTEQINIQAEMLRRKYTGEQVKNALAEMFYTHRFFPDAADIAKHICPEKDERDEALEISGRIFELLASYGEMQATEAREEMGELAWQAVVRFGGWTTLCRMSYSELGQSRAQLREICGSLRKQKIREQFEQIEGSGELKQINAGE